MATIIDIVDTAVKIGLGALISGVTTYLVTTKNHRHERNHDLVVYKRGKLVEVTENIQKAGALINEIVQGINFKKVQSGPLKDLELIDETNKVKEVCALVSSAVSISHLINDGELSGLLKEYWEVWNSMNYLLLNNKKNNWSEYNKLREQSLACKLKLYDQFSKSLEKIYA